jgi:hypothetical protein
VYDETKQNQGYKSMKNIPKLAVNRSTINLSNSNSNIVLKNSGRSHSSNNSSENAVNISINTISMEQIKEKRKKIA